MEIFMRISRGTAYFRIKRRPVIIHSFNSIRGIFWAISIESKYFGCETIILISRTVTDQCKSKCGHNACSNMTYANS